ncbi:hypothetical protein RI054_12g61770 [Pseudoscourfieldia marina]
MARVGTTRTTSTGKSKDIFEAEWPKRPSTNATPPPPDGLPNAKTLTEEDVTGSLDHDLEFLSPGQFWRKNALQGPAGNAWEDRRAGPLLGKVKNSPPRIPSPPPRKVQISAIDEMLQSAAGMLASTSAAPQRADSPPQRAVTPPPPSKLPTHARGASDSAVASSVAPTRVKSSPPRRRPLPPPPEPKIRTTTRKEPFTTPRKELEAPDDVRPPSASPAMPSYLGREAAAPTHSQQLGHTYAEATDAYFNDAPIFVPASQPGERSFGTALNGPSFLFRTPQSEAASAFAGQAADAHSFSHSGLTTPQMPIPSPARSSHDSAGASRRPVWEPRESTDAAGRARALERLHNDKARRLGSATDVLTR